MATTRKLRRVLWSARDVKTLRQRAGRATVPKIAKELKRSVLATRYKAHCLGLSLAMRK
jgi:hypothetical protein